NPHDVTGWHAYADFLAERGDPRGEFMQVQIALENEALSKKERDALKKTETALLKKHRKGYVGNLFGEGVELTFSRGWISRVEFKNLTVDQARALAKNPNARLLRELVVEEVEFQLPEGSNREDWIDSFYEPGPDVPDDLEDYNTAGLHALCRCPHLAGLRVFRLGEDVSRPGGREEEYFN